jgi:lactoylglutathione lyase
MQLGYTIVFVDDVATTLDFWERAFGLTRRFLHEAGDYGELDTGTTTLAFTSHALGAEAVPIPYRRTDPAEAPLGVELTLVTDAVATAYERAVAAGATPVAPPHDTPWGQVVSYVRDRDGTLVSIASPVSA